MAHICRLMANARLREERQALGDEGPLLLANVRLVLLPMFWHHGWLSPALFTLSPIRPAYNCSKALPSLVEPIVRYDHPQAFPQAGVQKCSPPTCPVLMTGRYSEVS